MTTNADTRTAEKVRRDVRRKAERAVRDALRDHGSASPEYLKAQAWLDSTKRRR